MLPPPPIAMQPLFSCATLHMLCCPQFPEQLALLGVECGALNGAASLLALPSGVWPAPSGVAKTVRNMKQESYCRYYW